MKYIDTHTTKLIFGGQTSNLFQRVLHQIEDLLGIDLPTDDDYIPHGNPNHNC